jgi:hypothetical protein
MNAAVLADDARIRLVKLAGMFGSAHDGERAAAALKFHALQQQLGLMPEDVLRPQPPAVVMPAGPRTWRTVCEEVLGNHFGALYQPREVDFLTQLLAVGRAPTPRQAAWLVKICHRTGVPLWPGAPR